MSLSGAWLIIRSKQSSKLNDFERNGKHLASAPPISPIRTLDLTVPPKVRSLIDGATRVADGGRGPLLNTENPSEMIDLSLGPPGVLDNPGVAIHRPV